MGDITLTITGISLSQLDNYWHRTLACHIHVCACTAGVCAVLWAGCCETRWVLQSQTPWAIYTAMRLHTDMKHRDVLLLTHALDAWMTLIQCWASSLSVCFWLMQLWEGEVASHHHNSRQRHTICYSWTQEYLNIKTNIHKIIAGSWLNYPLFT